MKNKNNNFPDNQAHLKTHVASTLKNFLLLNFKKKFKILIKEFKT
jgi:hypothetical protein